jgi:hypothetical protein
MSVLFGRLKSLLLFTISVLRTMLILLSFTLATVVSAVVPGQTRSTFENAFIIQLESAPELKDLPRDARNHVATFQKRATSIDYFIRHEFHNSDVFLALLIQMNGNQTQGEVYRLLHGIGGVVGVSSVSAVRIPAQQASSKVDPIFHTHIRHHYRLWMTAAKRNSNLLLRWAVWINSTDVVSKAKASR